MLSIALTPYIASCSPNSGGISRVWSFDPADFDWSSGWPSIYGSRISDRRNVGSWVWFFPIKFDYLEGELKSPLTVKGSSQKFAHTLTLHLNRNSGDLAQFLTVMTSFIACGSVGL